jgi:hypothetical protein
MSNKKLYTIMEFAKITHISHGFIYKWVNEGMLIPHVVLGSVKYFNQKQVDTVIAGKGYCTSAFSERVGIPLLKITQWKNTKAFVPQGTTYFSDYYTEAQADMLVWLKDNIV